jgi:hypothetical protein
MTAAIAADKDNSTINRVRERFFGVDGIAGNGGKGAELMASPVTTRA